MTSSGRWIDNFIIENGKVECQSQPNRMSWLHFRLWYVKGFLISFLRILNHTFFGFLFRFLNDVFLFLFRTTFDEHVQLSVRFRKCTCVFECLFVRSNNINNEKKERKRKEEEHIGMSKILEKKKVFFFLVELFKNKKKMLFILNTIESIEVKNRIESSEWEELEEESGFCRLIAIILIEFVWQNVA